MKPLLLLLFITLTRAFNQDWIDPHEIKISSNIKQPLKRSMSENYKKDILNTVPIIKENNANRTPTVETNTSLMFLKRAVNLILNSASAQKDDPNLYTGSYHFRTDTDEHKFLIDFFNKVSVSADDIRMLDTVLSSVFDKPHKNSFMNINFAKEDFYSALVHVNTLIMFGTTVCLLVFYFLFKNNYGILYIFSYFCFLILAVDFGIRYKFLQEEAEEHNLKLLYSESCDASKMSWGEYFKFALSQRNCERKIVTPLDVSLNQLKYIIIIPLESFGTGMGKFGKELWEKLPFPWNFLIFPLMLIFILALIFVFTIALRDSPFKMNFLHLFNLEFGRQHDEKNRVSGKTLDKLLEATAHRRMIEETKSSPKNKETRKSRDKNNSPPKNIEEKKDKKNSPEKTISQPETSKSSNNYSKDNDKKSD